MEGGHLLRVGRLEQAQCVILLCRQFVPAEEFVFEQPQPVVGSPEVEVGLLLGRIEPLRRVGLGAAVDISYTIHVQTSVVQTIKKS